MSKPKTPADYHTKDMYKFYRATVEEGLRCDYSTYSKVVNMCNKLLTDAVLEDACTITLPVRFGTLGVRKTKMSTAFNKMPVDWNATKKLWEENPEAKANKTLVKHLNEDRKGYIYKIHWSKKGMNAHGHKLYKFKPAKHFRKRLPEILKNNKNIDYYLY